MGARNRAKSTPRAPLPALSLPAPKPSREESPLWDNESTEDSTIEVFDTTNSQYPIIPLSPDPVNTTIPVDLLSSSRDATKPPSAKRAPNLAPKSIQKKGENLAQKVERLHWTFEMEEILFNTMLDQVRLGKRADSGYKSEAWNKCFNAVEAEYTGNPSLLTIEKLKSKLSNYQQLYKDWRWLLGQSGFGLHPETRVVTASSEAWEEVIRVCLRV
jgi:hypothetical protein